MMDGDLVGAHLSCLECLETARESNQQAEEYQTSIDCCKED